MDLSSSKGPLSAERVTLSEVLRRQPLAASSQLPVPPFPLPPRPFPPLHSLHSHATAAIRHSHALALPRSNRTVVGSVPFEMQTHSSGLVRFPLLPAPPNTMPSVIENPIPRTLSQALAMQSQFDIGTGPICLPLPMRPPLLVDSDTPLGTRPLTERPMASTLQRTHTAAATRRPLPSARSLPLPLPLPLPMRSGAIGRSLPLRIPPTIDLNMGLANGRGVLSRGLAQGCHRRMRRPLQSGFVFGCAIGLDDVGPNARMGSAPLPPIPGLSEAATHSRAMTTRPMAADSIVPIATGINMRAAVDKLLCLVSELLATVERECNSLVELLSLHSASGSTLVEAKDKEEVGANDSLQSQMCDATMRAALSSIIDPKADGRDAIGSEAMEMSDTSVQTHIGTAIGGESPAQPPTAALDSGSVESGESLAVATCVPAFKPTIDLTPLSKLADKLRSLKQHSLELLASIQRADSVGSMEAAQRVSNEACFVVNGAMGFMHESRSAAVLQWTCAQRLRAECVEAAIAQLLGDRRLLADSQRMHAAFLRQLPHTHCAMHEHYIHATVDCAKALTTACSLRPPPAFKVPLTIATGIGDNLLQLPKLETDEDSANGSENDNELDAVSGFDADGALRKRRRENGRSDGGQRRVKSASPRVFVRIAHERVEGFGSKTHRRLSVASPSTRSVTDESTLFGEGVAAHSEEVAGGMQVAAAFKCPDCGRGNRSKHALKVHRYAHRGGLPHVCQLCAKGFLHLSTLKVHFRTHTGEKPFQCSFCHRRFSGKANAQRHERTVHKQGSDE